jgi:K+-transporting ATPase KdpF subunit
VDPAIGRRQVWSRVREALTGLLLVLLVVLLVATVFPGELLASNPREAVMAIEYVIVGLLALGIAIYLAIALLRPDKF